MDNLSQNNLDNLFREGSEKVDFEYREDAWAALDERLNEKEKKRKLLWLLLSSAVSLLLIGAIFYYATNKTVKNTSDTEHTTATYEQIRVLNETSTPSLKSPISEENINSSQVLSTNLIANTDVNAHQITKAVPLSVQKNNFIENISVVKQRENFQILDKEEKEKSFVSIIKKASISEKISPIATLSLKELIHEKERQINQLSTDISLLENRKNLFSFSIFGSNDYNSLSLGNDKIERGYRIGLRADYNFTPRFSLGIGVAFSKKTYTAQGFRYNAKPDFWDDGIAPIEVQATCNIIEIPLELRFYSKGHNQDGFFAGTGINSYHLSLEQYNFHYDELSANPILNWEERGTNTNLFSVATFTFGYQKTINTNFSFQIAPYANLPFRGIGQGKVNLQSAGLNISVNWRK